MLPVELARASPCIGDLLVAVVLCLSMKLGDCMLFDCDQDLMERAIHEIDKQGYAKIPNLYRADDIKKASDLVVRWNKYTEPSLAAPPSLNVGHENVYNLQNKDIFFIKLVLSNRLLEGILIHYLNDRWFKQIPAEDPNYILRGLVARSSHHAMPLHIDSFMPYLSPFVYSLQFSIVLEDQTEANGCTIVVPGSHLSGQYAPQSALKDAVPIPSKAGDVVIWDSRLWHATTANTTGNTRWAIIASFVRWWIKQSSDVTRGLPSEFYAQLSDKEKAILGFCSMPPVSEFQRIETKVGYADLPRV
jgi:hypothetical protein